MATKSLLHSSLTDNVFYRSLLAGNDPYIPAAGSLFLLQTVELTSNTASLTLANLDQYASIYKHLQVRLVGRTTRGYSTESDTIKIRVNNDAGTNYSHHWIMKESTSIFGSSGGANATELFTGYSAAAPDSPSTEYGTYVTDIYDAFSTTKFKTFRTFFGLASGYGPTVAGLAGGAWRSTSQITSLNFSPTHGPGTWELAAGMRVSIYGIKG